MAKSDSLSAGFPGRTKQHQLPDSETESDPEDDQAANETGQSAGSVLRTQVIHSGHFMVSSPHSDSTSRRRKCGFSAGYDFDTVNRTWCQTYKYGPLSSGSLSIDPTLTRLFECMTLAYSGKIVSPKWKSFKGLRLLWRDKIRLNNGIWRAWYIQYIERRKNPVCGFITPLEGLEADAHRKPEAIVLEGSYWKRRIEVVIKEYHKWRIYYKKRLQKSKDDILPMLQKGSIYGGGLERWCGAMVQEADPMPEESHIFDLDCFLSDISDTLFTMTQKPCPWSEECHNTYSSNADMIQPGLTPLQPSLDDFMDIPDVFASCRGQPPDQTGYTEYFGSMPGSAFSVEPNVVSSGALLQAEGVPQTNLSAESSSRLPQASSSDSLADGGYLRQPLNSEMAFNPDSMSLETKYKGHVSFGSQSEYHTASLVPPYEQQAFGTIVSGTSVGSLPSTQGSPYLYPSTCLKYRHGSPGTAAVSSVITHTGSMTGVVVTEPHTHGYPRAEPFPAFPYVHPGYGPLPATQTAMPVHNVQHCFPVTQQLANSGKYKQESAGAKMAASAAPPTPPLHGSCLAKLLSAGTQERKPTVGPSLSEAKGHSSASPSYPQAREAHGGSTGAHRQHSSPCSSGHPHTALLPPALAPNNFSRGSSTSTLLTQTPPSTCGPLIVPKTEKLSPVQTYGSERTAGTGSSGQVSPINPMEKTSNPPSIHPKMDQTKTETRRITHISAEQKRRFNIKLGFDTLQNLVTTLSSQPSVKISKATTLQKTAEYISKMQQERSQLHEEAQRLREEIVGLNAAINLCQQQLPATGVPITRQRFDHMRDMFREYVRAQTLHNWKFWIFSIIFEPLFESYNGMVSTASVEDLCRTTLSWLDQYCSLPVLRPAVLSSLRLLSTSTSILSDPSLLPEQATMAVTQACPARDYP